MPKSLISFDIYSDFGFFKKPDVNKMGLTYNLPPKPAILGMVGSILGMSGINRQYEINESSKHGSSKSEKSNVKISTFPEYYEKLVHLKTGIKPIGDFPFNKIINTYNSRNSYFGNEKYENVVIHEQLLIKPKYRIYLYDQIKQEIITELANRLENNNPIFMPYLGKNEFIACFDNVKSTDDVKQVKTNGEYISSMFLTKKEDSSGDDINGANTENALEDSHQVTGLPTGFKFFENYPTGYSEDMHYILQTIQLAEKADKSSINFDAGGLYDIDGEKIYLF